MDSVAVGAQGYALLCLAKGGCVSATARQFVYGSFCLVPNNVMKVYDGGVLCPAFRADKRSFKQRPLLTMIFSIARGVSYVGFFVRRVPLLVVLPLLFSALFWILVRHYSFLRQYRLYLNPHGFAGS